MIHDTIFYFDKLDEHIWNVSKFVQRSDPVRYDADDSSSTLTGDAQDGNRDWTVRASGTKHWRVRGMGYNATRGRSWSTEGELSTETKDEIRKMDA